MIRIPLMLLILHSTLAIAQEHTLNIQFPLASAELDPAAKAELQAICERDDISSARSISLKGHADVRGGQAFNDALSRRRTEAVRDALQRTCLSGRDITIAWSGGSEPLSPMSSEEDHAMDRRVEVVFKFADERSVLDELHRHPKVWALMAQLDVPRVQYTADASNDIDILADDGVRIKIPAGAVLDANGVPVEGEIDLSYRSFYEPYEIIASGVPMHIGTGEEAGHFETAGMYELYASKDGLPLQLASEQRILLERPVAPPLDGDFVGWRSDPSSGEWEAAGEITTPSSTATTASLNLATEATAQYWSALRRLQQDERPDSTLFAERRNSSSYCHLEKCAPLKGEVRWKKKRDQFEDIHGIPRITVVGHKGIYDQDRIVFEIVMETKKLPEWQRLPGNAVWEYVGPDSRRTFKQLYGRKHVYQDIALDMVQGEETGTLHLKENGQWLSLPVSAKWNRTDKYKQAQWDRRIKAYQKELDKQENEFNAKVDRSLKKYERTHADPSALAWTEARRYMTKVEREMETVDWYTYAAARPWIPNNWENAIQDFQQVITTFALEGFGLYNIDRIMKMKDQLNVIAATQDPNGEQFPWVTAFAVLKNENSVITYWGSGKGERDEFLVAPGKMKSLFLVDAEGNIACADVSPLNSRESEVVIHITLLKDPHSMDELRAQADGPM